MRLAAHELHESLSAQRFRQAPRCGLVEPHEGRFDHDRFVEPERKRHLQALQGVVAAVRVARIVRLAHPAHERADLSAVTERGGEGEKEQVSRRHEGVRNTVGLPLERALAREGAVGNLSEQTHVEFVVGPESGVPVGRHRPHRGEHVPSAGHLHVVALAVAHAHRFDPVEAAQRPRQAGRGILAAGKQHECAARSRLKVRHSLKFLKKLPLKAWDCSIRRLGFPAPAFLRKTEPFSPYNPHNITNRHASARTPEPFQRARYQTIHPIRPCN